MFNSLLCILRAEKYDFAAGIVYPYNFVDEVEWVKARNAEHAAYLASIDEINSIDD